MKTARKVLLLVLCAALLVSASVLGTMAYLTDNAKVENTFTVGKVDISLDETDVNGGEARVTENEYHLLPGTVVAKDPIVHVTANSEDSWVFVKVENNIAEIIAKTEDGKDAIEAQIIANGWAKLSEGVYYQSFVKTQTDKDLEVFQGFTIDSDVKGEVLDAYNNKTIVVTAYAIQKAGFTDVQDAWEEVSKG